MRPACAFPRRAKRAIWRDHSSRYGSSGMGLGWRQLRARRLRRGDSGHARWRGISLTLAHLSSWTLIWRTAAPSTTPPHAAVSLPR